VTFFPKRRVDRLGVPARRQTDSALAWTLSFFRPYQRSVTFVAALSITEIVFRVLAPWPLKAIVDALASGHPPPAIGAVLTRVGAVHPFAWLGAVVLLGLLLELGHELVLLGHTRAQTGLAQRMVFDLRARLFAHLQYLSLSHHAVHSPADAVSRFDTDGACLESLLLKGVFPLVFSIVTLVVMFIILLRLDVALALLALTVVPFLYLSVRLTMRPMRVQAERARQLESAVVSRVHESLSAIRLVKMFAREEHELHRFSGIAEEAMRQRLGVTRQESWFGFLVRAITIGGASLVLGLGGLHVLHGTLTIGGLLVVVAYLGFVYGPLSAIATTTGSLHNAWTSARRVREVLRLPRETDRPSPATALARLRGEVSFDAVSFSYGDRVVLRDVTFTAAPGDVVALVGRSGAGKTTIVSLLGRLFEPSAGWVRLDGVDAHTMPLRWLREQIAVVPQDTILLSGSIADNIRYGRLEADEPDVRAAARAAGCDEFIASLPAGYQTTLGDLGSGLSGGQRQRLSIARAFLKNAPILILDEPTASLDQVSERAVLRALQRLREGRTTFVIAHRLSTVRRADRILVVQDGSVVAQGRHDQLLATDRVYQSLCADLEDDEAEAAVT
jgi:ATP-binding cassette subfamily B protein